MEYLFLVFVNEKDSSKLQHSYSSYHGVQYYVIAQNMSVASKKAIDKHMEVMQHTMFDSDGSLVSRDTISYFVSKIEFISDRLIK